MRSLYSFFSLLPIAKNELEFVIELNALSGEIVLLFKVYIAVWLALVEPVTLIAFDVANTPLFIFDLFFLFVVSLTPERF